MVLLAPSVLNICRELTGEGMASAVKTIQESLARERDPCVRARLVLVWAEILTSDNIEEVRAEYICSLALHWTGACSLLLLFYYLSLGHWLRSILLSILVVNTCCQYLILRYPQTRTLIGQCQCCLLNCPKIQRVMFHDSFFLKLSLSVHSSKSALWIVRNTVLIYWNTGMV